MVSVFYALLQMWKLPYESKWINALKTATDFQVIATLAILLALKATASDTSADNLGASKESFGVTIVLVSTILPIPALVASLATAVNAIKNDDDEEEWLVDIEMTQRSRADTSSQDGSLRCGPLRRRRRYKRAVEQQREDWHPLHYHYLRPREQWPTPSWPRAPASIEAGALTTVGHRPISSTATQTTGQAS